MSTRETLLASLEALHEDVDTDAVNFGDGCYVDWSLVEDDGRSFEVGDGTESVQLSLSREDLLRLHAALTRTLLAD